MRSVHRLIAPALAMLAFLVVGLESAALAQRIEADPLRVTVPAYASGQVTNIDLDLDTIRTNATVTLTVEITNTVGILSAVLDAYMFTAPVDNVLNTNAILTVIYDATVPQTGLNEIEIYASGDYTTRLGLPFKSAVFWAGDTNNTDYGTAANWRGDAVPEIGRAHV